MSNIQGILAAMRAISKDHSFSDRAKKPAGAKSAPEPKSSDRISENKFGRILKHPYLPAADITRNLVDHLRTRGYQFLMDRFSYQGSPMDVFSIHQDRIVEFEVKESGADYLNDFRKIYYKGTYRLNKHSQLAAGTGVPAQFYFVIPLGMLRIDEIPDHCGLIYAIPDGDAILFHQVKDAPVLHARAMTDGVYKTIAGKIYDRYISLTNLNQ